jgi:hypothetical protein
MPENGIKEVVETSRGINLEVCMVASDKKSLRMRWQVCCGKLEIFYRASDR